MLFNFSFVSQAFKAGGGILRCVCACIILCTVGGPILIISGIIIHSTNNSPDADLDAYNAAVRAFGNGTRVAGPMAPGRIEYFAIISADNRTAKGAGPMTLETDSVIPIGDTKNRGLVGASVYLKRNVPFPGGQSSAADAFLMLDTYTTVIREAGPTKLAPWESHIYDGIKATETAREAMKCNAKSGCSAASMRASCIMSRGSHSAYEGSGCSFSGACGVCMYPSYLERVCYAVFDTDGLSAGVLGHDGNGELRPRTYERHPKLKGCDYPFTSPFVYSSGFTGTIQVIARASTDPYIAYQRLTKGAASLDLSDAKAAGATQMIVMGVLLLFCSMFIGCVAFCVVSRKMKENGVAVAHPGHSHGYSLPAPMMMDADAAGMMYSQQQPLYLSNGGGHAYPPPTNAYPYASHPQQPQFGHPGAQEMQPMGQPAHGHPIAFAPPPGGYNPHAQPGYYPPPQGYGQSSPDPYSYGHRSAGNDDAYIPPPPMQQQTNSSASGGCSPAPGPPNADGM